MEKQLSFSIKQLTIYDDCRPQVRKNLHSETFLFTDTIGDGFFASSVNLSAIVGMNGSGKSSLLEVIFRMVNNFGAVLMHRVKRNFEVAHEVYYVDGIFADLQYLVDGVPNTLMSRGTSMGWCIGEHRYSFSMDGQLHEHLQDFEPLETESQATLNNLSRSFFYTIVTNYSIQAYNAADYRHEPIWRFDQRDEAWHRIGGESWINSLFHKNDGYACPITLNPYRDMGKININQEQSLTKARLEALLIEMLDKGAGQQYLANYELKSITYRLSKAKLVNMISWDESETLDVKFEMLIDRFKTVCECGDKWDIANIILRKLRIPVVGEDNDLLWGARFYLVCKVLTIGKTYPTFYEFASLGDNELAFKRAKDDEQRRLVSRLAKRVYKDKTHISLKVKQTLRFLSRMEEDTNRLKHLPDSFTHSEYEKVMGFEHPESLTHRTLVMPPPIFRSEILFDRIQEDGSRIENIPFEHLSSGERQFMFTTSAILYHALNVKNIKGSRPSYKCILIVLDEVEICFHPEMQRRFVKMLIDLLQHYSMSRGIYYHILLTTHSPFLLSDIPKSKILYLEEGRKPYNQDQFINPFAANVNDILRQSFFLKDGFIGDFAKEKILQLVKFLTSDYSPEREVNMEIAQNIVDIIGEPVIRKELQVLLDEYLNKHPELITENLRIRREDKIRRLKEELNRLETPQQ